jgi:hypothetical protein
MKKMITAVVIVTMTILITMEGDDNDDDVVNSTCMCTHSRLIALTD